MELKKLFDLTGRTAIITGGAGFLGRQHAAALAEMGAEVTLWDMKQLGLDAAAEELGATYPGRIHTQLVEVTDGAQIKAAVEAFTARHGKLNILVNNASITIPKGEDRKTKFAQYFDPFETYPLELWDLALKVNLSGIFLVTQALAPLLLKAAGSASIINIASDVGVISPDHRIYEPNPERDYGGANFNTTLSYSATKAAIIHMTRYWATYWAKKGIRVNSISPAGIYNSQDPKFMRELTDRIPLGRMGKPHELKGAISYLASDASSFMTGHNLMLDGGRTIW